MAITGVFTTAYLNKLAKLSADDLITAAADLKFASFRVGEGGYTTSGGIKIPKTPLASRTGIEATIDRTLACASNNSATGTFYPQALADSDVTEDSGGTVTVDCTLASVIADFDDTYSHLTGNCGNPPKLMEIGIYDANGTLAIYCTYDEVEKVNGTSIEIVVTVPYLAP